MSIPNILAARYASPESKAIWSPEGRIVLEREFWIAVMQAQRSLGLDLPAAVIDAYEKVKDQVDLASIERRERASLHDVKARIEEFNALAGHEKIHLGLTSRDLTETVEQMQVHASLRLLRGRAAAALGRIGRLAAKHADLVLTARTHNVPAQATTVGKRLAMGGDELRLAFGRLDDLVARYPLRGVQGAVGTQLDLLTLLGGDRRKLSRFDAAVRRHLGLQHGFVAVGQVYPRSLDYEVVTALAQLAAGPASFCTTLRLMAGLGLASEGFAEGQTGSSAMPHKMNARNCERVCGLRAILLGHAAMVGALAGEQWNEGDVSCSVVRRVALPDSVFAADGLFETFLTVLDRMEVYPAAVAAENRRQLPFLATTTVLMEAVKRGAGREAAHKQIKGHALAAARALRDGDSSGPDLLERLASDAAIGLSLAELRTLVGDGADLCGLAATQARAFATAARGAVRRFRKEAAYQPRPLL